MRDKFFKRLDIVCLAVSRINISRTSYVTVMVRPRNTP